MNLFTGLMFFSQLIIRDTFSHRARSRHIISAGGPTPERHQHEWVVGVHRRDKTERFEHVCGGSLIADDLVLSAAHCFGNDGKDVVLKNYRITAGNFYRDIDKEADSQKREIKKVVFHDRYRGNYLNYAYDIVLVVLKDRVEFKKSIFPIRINWNPSFEDNELQGKSGVVIGWGFTERNEPRETRVVVVLPYVPFGDCFEAIPSNFRALLTPDKFCAGLRNGTAVCPGDSGNGLAFWNSRDNEWYLRGIVSVGVVPRDESKCWYSAFTSISHYLPWLQKMITNERSSLNGTRDT